MTKERLEQYPAIIKEIEQLERYIKDAEKNGPPLVSDTVQSAANFPYSMHDVTVKGRDYALLQKWRDTLESDRRERDEICNFIENAKDPYLRKILRMVCHEGLTYLQIQIREKKDESTFRKMIDKYCTDSCNSAFSGL